MSKEFINIEQAIFDILDVDGKHRYSRIPYLESKEKELLISLPAEEAFNELIKYVDFDEIRTKTFEAISFLNTERSLLFLVNQLSNERSFRRFMVCKQLGNIKSKQSYDILFRVALFDISPDVRVGAVEVLSSSSNSYVLPMLHEIANRNDDEVDSRGHTPSNSARVLLSVFGQ